MWNLKLYEELSYIYTYDDMIYPTPLKLNELEIILNQNKFLNLWTDLIAVSSIKRIETKKVDEIDDALLRIEDKELRYKVESIIKQRRKDWRRVNLKVFDNVVQSCKQELL